MTVEKGTKAVIFERSGARQRAFNNLQRNFLAEKPRKEFFKAVRMFLECRMSVRRKRDRNVIEGEVFERQAHICKAFANATRLQMLDCLGRRDWAAAELQEHLGISKANLSQHVAILRASGIVGTRRKGRRVYLSLLMPEVKSACHLIRDVLRAQIRNGRRLTV